MTTVHALAAAKVNLGLEVLGRRPDGYHDIATVMQTVSVFDRLSFAPSEGVILGVSDSALAGDDNLALRAARLFRGHVDGVRGVSIALKKRIPSPAGLGGASSDAAATLVALSRLVRGEMPADSLLELAARLGSDVPFLLSGGTALAEGRGERLRRLRPLAGVWFVLVTPTIAIPRKTATLYAALSPEDLSRGESVRRLAGAIETGLPISPDLLGNAFRRPLLALRPDLAEVERRFVDAGAPFAALSGSGPTFYTIVTTVADARLVTLRLRQTLPRETRIMVCRPVARTPLIRLERD
jgi:4-diphosphocytidyl-2-C-methyl-D-erythritol kinase